MEDLTTRNDGPELGKQRSTSERVSLYNKFLSVPDGIEETLKLLLIRKQELKCEYLAACEENLILTELLLKSPQEWMTVKDAEKKMSEAEEISMEQEMNAVVEKRLSKMMETVDVATEVLHTWKCKVDALTQRTHALEAKKSELEGVDLKLDSLHLHRLEVRHQLEKVEVLLAAAHTEQGVITDRIQRMEKSLQVLAETQSRLEEECALSDSQLQGLQQTLEEMQGLSGIACRVLDPSTVRVSLLPRNLLDSPGGRGGCPGLDECEFTVDLKFAENSDGCLQVADVQTDQNVEEVKRLIAGVKEDKDLPKFISGLRATWQSYLPLTAEVGTLRKKHAIDFIQEQGVLQLIINKRNIVCTLSVPKSYPRGDVTLTGVLGFSDPAAIGAPEEKSLTAWVKYLEDLLGQR